MATTYTTNLKLALPTTGELSGTWGDTVNDNITKMVEEAITGVASLSTWVANAMTITTTNGTTSSGRCALLDLSGTLSATGTLTLPTANKQYIIRNGTTGGYSVTVGMASGATVSVPNGETVGVFTDGTDTKVIITQITKSLGIKSNSSTGITQFTGPGAGTTRVLTVPDADATLLTTNAAVTVAQGGTGATTLTLNNVILGNGTSAPQFVAPGTSGNILTSNGTTWTSAAPAAISGLTVAQGGTGATTLTANGVLIGNGTSAITAVAPSTSGNVLMSNGTSWASTALTGITVGNTSITVTDSGSNGTIILTVDGTEAARVASDGSVGIGTNNPTEKVHVKSADLSLLVEATGNNAELSAKSPTGQIKVGAYDASCYVLSDGALLLQATNALKYQVSSVTKFAVDTDGSSIPSGGLVYGYQASPTSKSGAATLTATELMVGMMEYTGTAANVQLPTGTDINSAISTNATTNNYFDWYAINTGSGTCTITTNTDLTLKGNMAIATSVSARFRFRKTGATTFTVYRI